MATGLPKSPTLNDLRSIVDAAAQSLLPYAREVADLWFYGGWRARERGKAMGQETIGRRADSTGRCAAGADYMGDPGGGSWACVSQPV